MSRGVLGDELVLEGSRDNAPLIYVKNMVCGDGRGEQRGENGEGRAERGQACMRYLGEPKAGQLSLTCLGPRESSRPALGSGLPSSVSAGNTYNCAKSASYQSFPHPFTSPHTRRRATTTKTTFTGRSDTTKLPNGQLFQQAPSLDAVDAGRQ